MVSITSDWSIREQGGPLVGKQWRYSTLNRLSVVFVEDVFEPTLGLNLEANCLVEIDPNGHCAGSWVNLYNWLMHCLHNRC